MLVFPSREYTCGSRVLVRCDVQLSPKCKKEKVMQYLVYQRNVARNKGKFICKNCRPLYYYGLPMMNQPKNEKWFRWSQVLAWHNENPGVFSEIVNKQKNNMFKLEECGHTTSEGVKEELKLEEDTDVND